MEKVNAMTEKQVEEFCKTWPSGYKKVNAMTEKQIQEFYDNCRMAMKWKKLASSICYLFNMLRCPCDISSCFNYGMQCDL